MKTGFYHRLLDQGMIEPEAEEPDIRGFEFWLDAFRELSSCRVSGMAIGPIPFTALVEYSRLYDVGDFEQFRFIIRIMDDKILELESEKSSKAGEKKNAPSNTDPTN